MSRTPRLRTSREVYDQIRWDPSLDARAFVIGYEAHERGDVEVPFDQFVPDGEIPWHRVWYIRRGDERVWDRRARVDRLRAAHARAHAPAPAAPATDDPRAAAPVYRSAVVLVPPRAAWPPIQTLRAAHDRHFERWMPHVTLVYGFVPDALFERAAALLAPAARAVAPFRVTLERLDAFHHRGSATVWLRPDADPPGALLDLQRSLQGVFPNCDEQSRKSPAGFAPHLSVGQLPAAGIDAVATTVAAWQSAWTPVAFDAREVALISRRGEEPFAVRYTVALGTGEVAAQRA